MDNIEWSDSRRVECVLFQTWITLKGQTVGGLTVLFKPMVNFEGSDSRRVECVLFQTYG